MAGTRHHYLPRFLQKGFASRVDGKKVFVWVYRKGGKVFEASTKDIGLEEHFYGRGEETNVDPEITQLETRFTDLLIKLRASPDKEEITDSRIAEFITHLCIRTKHLRDSLRESTNFLIESLQEYLSDSENLKDIILHDPELIANAFEAQIKNYKIPKPQRDMMMRFLLSMVSSSLDQRESEFHVLVKMFLTQIQKELPIFLKEAHITTLSEELIPEPRIENYHFLKWFVCQSEVPLILGDVGCLFKVSENRYKSLDGRDNIESAFLPISHNQMLVGTLSESVPEIDFQAFKQVYIKQSREYFICAKPSMDMDLLASSIGEESGIISKVELEQIVKEIMAKRKS